MTGWEALLLEGALVDRHDDHFGLHELGEQSTDPLPLLVKVCVVVLHVSSFRQPELEPEVFVQEPAQSPPARQRLNLLLVV